jgi:hypothetical protein
LTVLSRVGPRRVGPRRVGPRRVGLVERDRVGQDEKRLVAREQELGSVSLGPKLALFSAPFSPLSLCPFHQISIKSREACISDFLQLFVPFGPRCLPNMAANLVLPLVHMYVVKSRSKSPG